MDQNIKCRTSNNNKTRKRKRKPKENEKERDIVKIIIKGKCEQLIT